MQDGETNRVGNPIDEGTKEEQKEGLWKDFQGVHRRKECRRPCRHRTCWGQKKDTMYDCERISKMKREKMKMIAKDGKGEQQKDLEQETDADCESEKKKFGSVKA